MAGTTGLSRWASDGRASSVSSILRSIVRTEARLTRARGAKRGANSDRRRATPGHAQLLSAQLNGALGPAQRHLATCRKCLLSSRPQVRILLGALTKSLVRA